MTGVRLPGALIIGAMRSGTTSLARWLGEHPEVRVAPEKEIHFFDLHFDRGLDWYASRFRLRGDVPPVLLEATQSYMYDPESLQRIAGVLPGVRLVAILRDPVDRAYSHYWLNRSIGRESLSFAEALSVESERLRSGNKEERFWFSYADRGSYLRQLDHIRTVLPNAPLMIIQFEQMRDQPLAVFRRVCRFLGISDASLPTSVGRRLNQHASFRSVRVRRLTKDMPRVVHRVVGRINTTTPDYPELEAVEREAIALRFRPDFPGLAARYDVDLALWPSHDASFNTEQWSRRGNT